MRGRGTGGENERGEKTSAREMLCETDLQCGHRKRGHTESKGLGFRVQGLGHTESKARIGKGMAQTHRTLLPF